MGYRGNGSVRKNAATYTAQQVRAVLRGIGVVIESETSNDYLCFCPYHGNKRTPSFNVSKHNGFFTCFNQACAQDGTLEKLVRNITGKNPFEVARYIAKKESETHEDFINTMARALEDEQESPLFPQEVIDRTADDFWFTPEAVDYMHGRGFEDETLKHFNIGYSAKQDMVMVPIHDVNDRPIGIVGRGLKEKVFKNSPGLQKSKHLFNLNRAKKAGSTVIVVEASFDAMMVHQAGFPNVVAILGGNATPNHYSLLEKYFDTVVLMTDYDDKNDDKHTQANCRKCRRLGFENCQGHNPGRELGHALELGLRSMTVEWAYHGNGLVYPEGAKDACDMTREQIKHCINNSISGFEYNLLNLD